MSASKVKEPSLKQLTENNLYTLFDSHLRYAAPGWGQGSSNVVDMVKRARDEAVQITSFKDRIEPSYPLYANHRILKLQNIITLKKCLFIYDQLCHNLPNVFLNYFKLLKDQHRQSTRASNKFTLNVPRVNTETYGSNSVKIKTIKDWNKTTIKIQFHPDLLFKRTEYLRLVKASF